MARFLRYDSREQKTTAKIKYEIRKIGATIKININRDHLYVDGMKFV